MFAFVGIEHALEVLFNQERKAHIINFVSGFARYQTFGILSLIIAQKKCVVAYQKKCVVAYQQACAS